MNLYKKFLVKSGLFLSDILRFVLNIVSEMPPEKSRSSKLKNLFIITSTINPTHKRKMAFNSKQRFKQTLKTIYSIRECSPDSDIFLLDNSSITNHQKRCLTKLVNRYYDFSNYKIHKYLRDYATIGMPETIMILSVINDVRKLPYKLIFKISGRYFLTKDFNITAFATKKMTFRPYKYNVSTRLYSFPNFMINIYRRQQIASIIGSLFGASIEDLIARGLMPKFFVLKSNIGLKGFIGSSGEAINE